MHGQFTVKTSAHDSSLSGQCLDRFFGVSTGSHESGKTIYIPKRVLNPNSGLYDVVDFYSHKGTTFKQELCLPLCDLRGMRRTMWNSLGNISHGSPTIGEMCARIGQEEKTRRKHHFDPMRWAKDDLKKLCSVCSVQTKPKELASLCNAHPRNNLYDCIFFGLQKHLYAPF